MTITPEEARRLAEQTEYPTPWKWAEGPNPVVGEYVDDATATTKFGTEKRIKILRDAGGKRWAVWLLGQLDVQWDELEPAAKHGDLVAVWVRPGDKVKSAGGNEYRPSRITLSPKTGSPDSTAAVRHDGEVAPAAAAARAAGEPAPTLDIRGYLKLLGVWDGAPGTEPPPSVTAWIQEVGVKHALQALHARCEKRGLLA